MSQTCDLGVGELDTPFLCGHVYHCQPCSVSGQYEQAMGYCVNCSVYLCRQCYRVHRIPSSSQSHVMLHADHVTKRHPTVEEIFTDKCQIHVDRVLFYHCQNHEELTCTECISQAHKQCTNISQISDAIEAKKHKDELQLIQGHINEMIEKCSTIGHIAMANIVKRRTNDEDLLNDIKHFRYKINGELDKLEQSIKYKIKLQTKKETERLERVSTTAYQVLNNMRNLQEHFNQYMEAGELPAVFRGMKSINNLTVEIEELVSKAESENHTKIYTFKAENEILESIKSIECFGELYPQPKPVRASFRASIDVNTKGDERADITDLVALDNMLVLSDHCNSKVKVIDISKLKARKSRSKLAKLKSKVLRFRTNRDQEKGQGKIIAEYVTESAPWSIAAISPDLFVVTLPYATKLLYLQLWDKTLRPAGQVDMSGQCLGIAHKNGRLVVSFINPECIKVLDIRGNILDVIDQDEFGQPLFTSPTHLAISHFSLPTRVYVLDNNNKIICITMEGEILNTFYNNIENCITENGSDKIIIDYNGTARGKVFTCRELAQNLSVIAAKCEQVHMLLYHDEDKVLIDPSILHYDEANSLLYVQEQNDESDCVQIYQIEEME